MLFLYTNKQKNLFPVVCWVFSCGGAGNYDRTFTDIHFLYWRHNSHLHNNKTSFSVHLKNIALSCKCKFPETKLNNYSGHYFYSEGNFCLIVAKEPFVRTPDLPRSCECYKSFTASVSILASVSVMNTEPSVPGVLSWLPPWPLAGLHGCGPGTARPRAHHEHTFFPSLKNVKLFKGFKHFSWKVKQNKVLRENKITWVCKLKY